jgi:hypothetical protein
MDSQFHTTKSTTRDDRLRIQTLYYIARWSTNQILARLGYPLKEEIRMQAFYKYTTPALVNRMGLCFGRKSEGPLV